VFNPYVNPMLGRALAIAVTRSNGGDVSQAFAEVDLFIDANGPVKIYGRMPNYNVFTDKSREVIISYPKIPDGLRPMAGEVKRLSQTGRVVLPGKKQHKCFSQLLAAEAAAAVANPPAQTTAVKTILKAANDYLEQTLRSRVQSLYIAASLGFVLVCDLIAALICLDRFFHVEDRTLLLGIVGATAGAFASVLLRSNKMEVNCFVPSYQVVIQGAVRIALG